MVEKYTRDRDVLKLKSLGALVADVKATWREADIISGEQVTDSEDDGDGEENVESIAGGSGSVYKWRPTRPTEVGGRCARTWDHRRVRSRCRSVGSACTGPLPVPWNTRRNVTLSFIVQWVTNSGSSATSCQSSHARCQVGHARFWQALRQMPFSHQVFHTSGPIADLPVVAPIASAVRHFFDGGS